MRGHLLRVLAARRRRRRRARDRCNETISAARNSLNVGWLRRVVVQRLAQLRYGLRQRVIGDRNVGPERLEQLVLRHQRRRTRDEVEQQVDDLGGERHDVAGLGEAVGRGVDRERTEVVDHRPQAIPEPSNPFTSSTGMG